MKRIFLLIVWLFVVCMADAQLMVPKTSFTKADTLRGSITPYRMGWDVLQYDITVQPDILQKTIVGKTIITYYESLAVSYDAD